MAARCRQSDYTGPSTAICLLQTPPLVCLADIATGNAVSPKRCAEMLDLLKRDPSSQSGAKDDQAYGYTGMALPRGSRLWSKAGWTSRACHDAAYLEFPNGARFILVIFTVEHANKRSIIPFLAGIITKEFVAGH